MTKPKRPLRSLFIFNGLLLVIAFAAIQFSVVRYEDSEPAPMPTLPTDPVLNGRMAEAMTVFDTSIAFHDFTFKTAFDKDITLDNLKGQWVVLNFWATWCPPCLVEMPSLQALQDKIGGQGIQVMAVSLDRNMNGEKLRKFMDKNDFGPVAAFYDADGTVMRTLNLKGLPTTYILAPNGRVFSVFEGDADWTSEDALAFIQSLIDR